MNHPPAFPLFALSVAVLLAGCSDNGRPDCYPVRGQVKLGDKPIEEALIVFHPRAAAAVPTPKPTALSDPQGNFSLTTFGDHDGAPAGEYVITVEQRAPRMVGEELVRDGKNLLPPKYARSESSELTFQVLKGSNDVPTLILKAQ